MKPVWILLFSLFGNGSLWAASCCGGGSSLPSFITGDYRAQISGSFSQSQITADIQADGLLASRNSSNSEVSKSLALHFAYQLTDFWQFSISTVFIDKQRGLMDLRTQSRGIGDCSIATAFEFLPEISYSPWKPRAFAYSKVSIPTGPSIYDAKEPLLVDARGRGLYSLGFGSFFIKTFVPFDFLGNIEVHQGIHRSFYTENGVLLVQPSQGYGVSLGGGFNPGESNWRIGLILSKSFEGEIQFSGSATSSSRPRWYWEVALTVSYLLKSGNMLNISFSDQGIIGDYSNTAIEKQVGIMYQHRVGL